MIQRLIKAFYRVFMSPKKYAQYIGVKIGKNCFIATKNWSSEPYLIEIGDNVQITRNVSVHTHGGGHVVRGKHPNYDSFGKVIIKDGAYIGAFSQIMPGVTIGKGALVAAGSIVTKSVPDGVVVAGNPAKFVCTVDEYIERNEKYNMGTKGLSYDAKKKALLNMEESKFIKKGYIKIN
ncbi:MAG: acyltransferase [Bacteroidaceae bacterium]|nr:acyltransferase [Bacteroidaceae bacterium]